MNVLISVTLFSYIKDLFALGTGFLNVSLIYFGFWCHKLRHLRYKIQNANWSGQVVFDFHLFSLLVEKIKIKLHNYFTPSILYKYNTTGFEEAFSVALLQAHSFPSDHNINWASACDHVTSSSHCILFFCFHFHSLSQSYRIVLPWPIVSLSGMRPMTIHAVTSDSTTATAPQKNTSGGRRRDSPREFGIRPRSSLGAASWDFGSFVRALSTNNCDLKTRWRTLLRAHHATTRYKI